MSRLRIRLADRVPLEQEVPLAAVDKDSLGSKAFQISLEGHREAKARVLSETFLTSSRRCSVATRKVVERQKLRLRVKTS